MTGLLDSKGMPLAPSADSLHKKATPPKMGEAFSNRHVDGFGNVYYNLAAGGILQFDLNRLTLADFRMMRDHYQVNASLSVLTFMMHQLDWRIECENEKIRKHCEDNMREVWTRLVRAMSQAFWAGYAPNVLQWDNDIDGRKVMLTKVKDLLPEDCSVNWKSVDGYAPPGHIPPKIKVYDGIKQYGLQWPIPTENSLWYPLLMENGNYYGRKLLRPAFTSWFFSIVMHLFSNRYFERFGEPLPIGRAPYDDEIDVNGKKVPGTTLMMGLLQNLRSRGAVVLPSERSTIGTETEYDYGIEYLESQMRGADFERYLMRLDEEISLALFTPLLMLRTADVGSYNLGTTHSQVYMQMLNALSGDWKEYIDNYILNRMVDFNFGPKAKRARIKFRKLGDDKFELVKSILQMLISKDKIAFDLEQLGMVAGLTLEEVKEVTSREEDPDAGANGEQDSDPEAQSARRGSGSGGSGKSSESSAAVAKAIYARLESQIGKARRDGTFGDSYIPDPGYRRRFEDALRSEGMSEASARGTYDRVVTYLVDAIGPGAGSYVNAEHAMLTVKRGVDAVMRIATEA